LLVSVEVVKLALIIFFDFRSEPLDLKAKLALVKRREKKSPKKERPRSTSKSPRSSRIIPGVRIKELTLRKRNSRESTPPNTAEEPSTPVAEQLPMTLPIAIFSDKSTAASKAAAMAVSDIWTDESPNVSNKPFVVENLNLLQETLTESRVLELEAGMASDRAMAMASSVCSTLSAIGPPSLMEDSMIKMGSSGDAAKLVESPKLSSSTSSPVKIECRHTLSAKKGFSVPEPVRRALGASFGANSNAASIEDLSHASSGGASSLTSSCQSNLENIRPPTMMEDMDNSIMSIASLNSEVAESGSMVGSAGSAAGVEEDLNTEQIFEFVKPAAQQAETLAREYAAALEEDDATITTESPLLSRKFDSVADDATVIQDIEVPSAMDDVSGVLTEKTLVPDQPGVGATYIIGGHGDDGTADVDQSTCKDITDVFDDDTTLEQHTFTLESDDKDDTDVDDLPRDSRRSTPASSREHTPKTQRKAEIPSTPVDMDHYRQFQVPIPDLDDSECLGQDTSGYKSDSTTTVATVAAAVIAAGLKPSPSSRQRRKDDSERFRTHTITKEDLSGTNTTSGSSREGSPRSPRKPTSSVKQRREEKPERFRTRTITASDLHQTPKTVGDKYDKYDQEEVLFDLTQLEEEAKLVVDAITDHKKDLRSRSASVEILEERDMSMHMQISSTTGSEPSLLASPKRRPRICKPGETLPDKEESPPAEIRGIRGRRKPLFSTPPKRSTVPPALPPKPVIAPKPRTTAHSAPSPLRMASPNTGSPTHIRGTRTTSLRQTSSTAIRNGSPPSPKMSPQSVGSNSSSARSSLSSNRSSKRSIPLPLTRQGTFTKDEPAVGVSSGDESIPSSAKIPPRVPTKPASMRRDMVHPQARIASPGASSMSSCSSSRSRTPVVIAQTKTSALRERSTSRAAAPTNLKRIIPGFAGSNSSLNSMRSNKSNQFSIKSSTSSHALRPLTEAGRNKRAPSSSALETKRADISDTQSEKNTSTSSKKGVNKRAGDVTSRIASLWKKVEDSKKKGKGKPEVDPRVWMTKGKVIPENELALLTRHEEQKEIVEGFQANRGKTATSTPPFTDDANNLKPRSKSRLSMKLSKFKSGSKKDLTAKTPTSPVTEETDEVAVVVGKNLDCVNGNTIVTPVEENQMMEEVLVEESTIMQQHRAEVEEEKAKRLSRLGSMFYPPSPNECGLPTADPIRFRRDLSNRSPAPASAIVPPYNYSPPTTMTRTSTTTTTTTKARAAESEFRIPAAPARVASGIPGRIAVVRRNDSYVSSMGRRSPDSKKKATAATPVASTAEESNEGNDPNNSSSMLVTLV
jgi:adenomatosis polyposis coli protein